MEIGNALIVFGLTPSRQDFARDVEKRRGEIDAMPTLLKSVKSVFDVVPDEALDVHTVQGRKLGRGDLFWYEVSSETVNKTPVYEKWREWFKPLMIEVVKAKEANKK